MTALRLALLAALSIGCGARTLAEVRPYPDDAAVGDDAFVVAVDPSDAFVADGGTIDAWFVDGGDPCGVDRTPLHGMVCEETIVADGITPSCGTGLGDVVAQGEGILRWECGATRAEASFAGGTYSGIRTGHSFMLCTSTQFAYDDGCYWQSTQRVQGSLDHGELTMTRDEAVTFSDGSCVTPCGATVVLRHP